MTVRERLVQYAISTYRSRKTESSRIELVPVATHNAKFQNLDITNCEVVCALGLKPICIDLDDGVTLYMRLSGRKMDMAEVYVARPCCVQ